MNGLRYLSQSQLKWTLFLRPLLEYRRHATNQVGLEDPSFVSRVITAFSTDRKIYLKRYEQFQALYTQVSLQLPDEQATLSQLAEKLEHFHARGTLPSQNLRRIPVIVHELIRGRYQRYSGSVLNSVRDLILRH